MKISACGEFRPKVGVWDATKDRTPKPKVTYQEYLAQECLTRKLTQGEIDRNNIKLGSNEEAWFFDDNKVPLCGTFGIGIVKNGSVVRTVGEVGNY